MVFPNQTAVTAQHRRETVKQSTIGQGLSSLPMKLDISKVSMECRMLRCCSKDQDLFWNTLKSVFHWSKYSKIKIHLWMYSSNKYKQEMEPICYFVKPSLEWFELCTLGNDGGWQSLELLSLWRPLAETWREPALLLWAEEYRKVQNSTDSE